MALRKSVRKRYEVQQPVEAVEPTTAAASDEADAPEVESHGHGGHGPHDHIHEPAQSFFRKYLFSTDHKVIGIQFLITSLIFFVIGGMLAMLVRWQLAYPNEAFPMGEFLPQQLAINGAMTPDGYNVFFTMHASVMIFFVIIPMLVGAFGNYLIPLQIGARDMAFPFLNALAYWFALPAGGLMVLSFFLDGHGANTGWTAYPPISVYPDQTNIGQTLWIISLILLGISSVMGAVNYITTILNMRTTGMTLFRMPLSVWALFITSILILFATPVLSSAMIMLLADRELGTSFFTPMEGGQPLLFQHLFWFYSHPAVYIMILPAMGIVSEIISVFSRKPVFGYRAMIYAIMAIAGLGFIVWGHHMFQSGMNPYLGTTFSAATIAIAIPSAIKTFNWLGTLWGGNIRFTTPMLNALAFVSMFVIGGLSGIFMAANSVDIYIHDTYFIVAHIHYVLFGGSVFGIFAGIYYWFPKMFGRQMDERLGKLHFILTFISYNCTFFPMHILGIGGMMRRIAQPTLYDHLQHWQDLNIFVTISAFVLGLAQIPFIINFIGALGVRPKSPRVMQGVAGFFLAAAISIGAHIGLSNFLLSVPGLAEAGEGAEAAGLSEGVKLALQLGVLSLIGVLTFVFTYLLPTKISLSALGAIGVSLWLGTNVDILARDPEFQPTGTEGWFILPWMYTILGLGTTLASGVAFFAGMIVQPKLTGRAFVALLCGLAAAPYAKLLDFTMVSMGGIDTTAGPILLGIPLYTTWGLMSGFMIFALVAGYFFLRPAVIGAPAADNPWDANTLEFGLTSPPWYANFKELPVVHHGPYEYSAPGIEEDFLMQTDPRKIPSSGH